MVRVRKLLTDPTAFATGIVFGSPLFGQICERDPEAAACIRDRMATAIAREYGAVSSVQLQAIVFEARRPV